MRIRPGLQVPPDQSHCTSKNTRHFVPRRGSTESRLHVQPASAVRVCRLGKASSWRSDIGSCSTGAVRGLTGMDTSFLTGYSTSCRRRTACKYCYYSALTDGAQHAGRATGGRTHAGWPYDIRPHFCSTFYVLCSDARTSM